MPDQRGQLLRAWKAAVVASSVIALFLGPCATANTPQQDLAYARWAKCHSPFGSLVGVDLDGRITFRYTTAGEQEEILDCLAETGRTGPPLPEAIGIHPPGGGP